MKIKRPEPRTRIPKYAKKETGIVADTYTWEIKRPDGKYKTFRKLCRPDIIHILPITPDNNVLIIELSLPSGEKENRILEMEFRNTSEVLETAFKLLSNAGLSSSQLDLLTKTQPFDVGEYPIDCAVYLYLAKDVSVNGDPELDYLVKYKLKQISLKSFTRMINQSKIANSFSISSETIKSDSLFRNQYS